ASRSRTRERRVGVQKDRSESSTSLVSRVALSESVRATTIACTSRTSAARRAALSVRTNWLVETSTFPPRRPLLVSEASWSSKWTPPGPGLDHGLHQLEGVQRAAEPGLCVRDHRREPVDA